MSKYPMFPLYVKQELGYEVLSEYRFSPPRKYRHDFFIPELSLAIEVEGGVWMGKARHTSGVGYSKDLEKYNLSATCGIILLRYTPQTLMRQQVLEDIKKIANLKKNYNEKTKS